MGREADSGRNQRLPSGRHGLPREFVVRSQRDRMLDAIAWAVARKGYGAVTVADVLARAQVSRTTFYEQFRDKQDCFLAAFDAIAARFLERSVLDQDLARLGWPERIELVLERMLDFFASEPDFARMCLVESLGAGELAWQRYQAAVDVIAAELDAGAHDAGEGPAAPTRSGRAAVFGIAAVVREEILAGRVAGLPELLGDLVYSAVVPFSGVEAALERRAAAASRTTGGRVAVQDPAPPAGIVPPQGPPPEPGSPRERLVLAMLQSLAERGFVATSVADVTRLARTSRTTFYAEFANKEDCFLAAHDFLVHRLRAHVAEAYRPDLPWADRVSAGLVALADTVAAYPALARTLVLEAVAAGPQAHARLRGAIHLFVPFVEEGLGVVDHGARLPPTAPRVAVGAVAGTVLTEVAAGRGRELPNVTGELVHAVLVQVMGPQEAARHAPAAAAS